MSPTILQRGICRNTSIRRASCSSGVLRLAASSSSRSQSLLETFARAETRLEDNALGLSSCLSAKDLPGEARTATGDCLSRVAPSFQPCRVPNRPVTSRGKPYTFLQAHARRRVTLRRDVIKLCRHIITFAF